MYHLKWKWVLLIVWGSGEPGFLRQGGTGIPPNSSLLGKGRWGKEEGSEICPRRVMTARWNGDPDQRPREEASEEPPEADRREVLCEGRPGEACGFRGWKWIIALPLSLKKCGHCLAGLKRGNYKSRFSLKRTSPPVSYTGLTLSKQYESAFTLQGSFVKNAQSLVLSSPD